MKSLLSFVLIFFGVLVVINAFAPSFNNNTLGYFGGWRVSGALVIAAFVAMVLKGK